MKLSGISIEQFGHLENFKRKVAYQRKRLSSEVNEPHTNLSQAATV